MSERLDAVLFDLDGTLVDSRDAIWDAFRHALDARKHALPARADVERLIGRPLEEMFREAASVDAVESQRLVAEYAPRFASRAGDLLRFTTGALEALDALAGTPLAIVTNKRRAPTILTLEALRVRERFRVVIARDDVPRLKPHPDPVLAACRALDVAPPCALLVGDTDLDVRSARHAGARAVGVLTGAGTREELARAGAERVYEDLAEMARDVRAKRL